jgi:outer membrane protein
MEVYRKAMQNDPQILAASYVHSAAGESIEEERGRMLPQLGFEYSRSSTDQDIKESDNALSPTGKTDFSTKDHSLTLNQPLFDWSLYTGYRQAKADVQRADAEFISKQQDLILRTAERYLEALAATDEVDFSQSEKAAVKKQLELMQSMMRGGMARKTELYDAQARHASVEADEITARSNRDDKLQALREIAGELSGDLAMLKADVQLVHPEPRNPESWMQSAIEQNPRVMLQLRAVEVSRYEIQLQKSGHLPTLDLTARLNNRDSGGTQVGSGGTEIETGDVLLRLNVPLYQGGIVNSRTRKAQQLHQKTMQDLTEVQRAVQRDARAAYHGIISAISKVDALRKSVESQELALESRQVGYKSGMYTSIDVLDAERDVFKAKRDYSRARYDYLLNRLRLKYSVGMLSESDVEEINGWLQASAQNVQ